MNLLDKNWPGLLIVVALAIFSCEDSSDIGLGLDPDGIKVNVLYTELPLEATNVRIDSIRTSEDSRLLLGKNVDPIFGTTSSTFISQLSQASAIQTLVEDHKYVIDSTVINLNVDKVHTNDVAPSQHFDVYQLTDTLFSSASYLSEFETPYRTDIKEGSFDILLNEDRIRDKDSLTYILQYRMSDHMGERLFAIANGDEGSSLSPTGALRYEYKGIAIVGSESNTVLLGIKPTDSTNITVHYHIIDPYIQSNVSLDSIYADSLQLTISMSNFFYNNITTDRTGSLMMEENGNYNSFKAGDGNIYLQPASGIYPKVNLDTLKNFFNQNPNIQVNRMEFAMETSINSKYNANVSDLRYFFVEEADGSKINAVGLAANVLFNTVVMTDNGYLANIPESLISPLDETSLTYIGVPTFFAQLVEGDNLEVDHAILIPQDVTTPDYSIFDEETGFRIRLYYTLPE